jgi:hypothetical protein
MAARLGIEGDKFPVTPQLVINVLFGLGVFNEFLLLPLAIVIRNGGNAGAASLCVAASGGLGLVLYLVALAWQTHIRWLRTSDAMLYSLVAVPVFGGAVIALCLKRGDAALVSSLANLLLAGWLARGFLRRARAKRRRD